MSGSRACLEYEQRLCVEEIDRTGRLYWMIRIPASQHMRRMGATATSVSCVVSCLESALSHTLPLASTPFQLVWILTGGKTDQRPAPMMVEALTGASARRPLPLPPAACILLLAHTNGSSKRKGKRKRTCSFSFSFCLFRIIELMNIEGTPTPALNPSGSWVLLRPTVTPYVTDDSYSLSTVTAGYDLYN